MFELCTLFFKWGEDCEKANFIGGNNAAECRNGGGRSKEFFCWYGCRSRAQRCR
ncbi:hypothetical protein THOE12_60129 [Vibrio rotiferianus]|nr:hypothetical protein THOE12_60129 [Vibrio rotiferianus]